MIGRNGRTGKIASALLAALVLAMEVVSCSRPKGARESQPHVIVVTPSEALSPVEFHSAEGFVRACSASGAKADVSHVVLPDLVMFSDKTGSSELKVAAFIATAVADSRVKAIVVEPAVQGSAEGFHRAKASRPELFCIAGDSREDELAIEASADLVVDLDRVHRAWLVPWAARKMGAKAVVAAYTRGEMTDPRAQRERAIMSAACSDLGLKYAAMAAPAGIDAVTYTRAMTGAWFRDYGKDTALYCSDRALSVPLLAGAIAGGGVMVDAAGSMTRAVYAAALGVDFAPANGDARKEFKLLEGAIEVLGGRGRLGLWDADYVEASVAGLAEFALHVASGSARKDDLKDLVAALDDRSHPAAWLAAYDVDPDTGVKSGNHVLVRQDIHVLGSGYLQSALQVVPLKYLTIAGDGH